jgi:hypothetical protein
MATEGYEHVRLTIDLIAPKTPEARRAVDGFEALPMQVLDALGVMATVNREHLGDADPALYGVPRS